MRRAAYSKASLGRRLKVRLVVLAVSALLNGCFGGSGAQFTGTNTVTTASPSASPSPSPSPSVSPGCPYTSQITTSGTYTLDVKTQFADPQNNGAIDWASLNNAIVCARTALGNDAGHGVTLVIQLPSGTLDLSKTFVDGNGQPLAASIDIRNFNCVNSAVPNCGLQGGQPTNSTNQLVIRGAGTATTTVVLAMNAANHAEDVVGIVGGHSVNVTLADMTFSWPYMTVTQGIVAAATSASVTIDIPPGFPSTQQILDTVNFPSSGRFLRKYQYFNQPNDPTTYCRVIEDPLNTTGGIAYSQVAWSATSPDPNVANRWVIQYSATQTSIPFAVGDLIAVKSKEGKNVFNINEGGYIKFDHLGWSRRSRGAFTGNLNAGYGTPNITVQYNTAAPEGPINGIMPCMSTPDGGPQFGGQLGLPSSGHVVINNSFTATGDDSLAFFDVSNSQVTGNVTYGSYSGRGIMFDFSSASSPVTDLSNAGINYCSPLNTFTLDYLYEMTVAHPSGLQATCP